MVSAAPSQQKAFCDVSAVCCSLFCTGIFYQLLSGMEMGRAVVGLQRLSPGFERADLPAGGGVLRSGGHGAELLSHASVHETVSQNFPQAAPHSVRYFPDRVPAGRYLLCGQPQHGLRNFGVTLRLQATWLNGNLH